MNNKNNEFKQWKQQYRIIHRRQQQSQKNTMKVLSSYSTVNPQSAQKINKILSQKQHKEAEANKQSTQALNKLKKINQNIGELKQTLKYFQHTNQFLMKVQKLSQGIFGKMETMKNQMANSYDQLDDMENKLSNDLQLWDKKIQGFEKGNAHQVCQNNNNYQLYKKKETKNKQNFTINKRVVSNKNIKSTQINELQRSPADIFDEKMHTAQQNVEQIDESIRQLGKNLGWPQQDHKDFLTIWNRSINKNYFQIEDELSGYFNFYTNEQIQDHMNKYIKLKKLTEQKKQFIQQYKELKQQKKNIQLAKLQSEEVKKQKFIKKQIQKKKDEQEQKQMKQKVELWKKKKEEQKNMEKQRQKEQEQVKKRAQIQRRRQQEIKRKQILQKWKQQKQQKKQKQSQQTAKRPNSAMNRQTLQRVRQRQQKMKNQQMQKIIAKKMEKQEIEKKAERIKQHKYLKYAHVGSKLEKQTTAMKEKKREKFDGKEKKQANTFGGQLMLTGVRAVPEWRQGL